MPTRGRAGERARLRDLPNPAGAHWFRQRCAAQSLENLDVAPSAQRG
jgi:hypothetical protein